MRSHTYALCSLYLSLSLYLYVLRSVRMCRVKAVMFFLGEKKYQSLTLYFMKEKPLSFSSVSLSLSILSTLSHFSSHFQAQSLKACAHSAHLHQSFLSLFLERCFEEMAGKVREETLTVEREHDFT